MPGAAGRTRRQEELILNQSKNRKVGRGDAWSNRKNKQTGRAGA